MFVFTKLFLVAMVSESDSDPPSPRSAKQMNKLQRNVEEGRQRDLMRYLEALKS